MHIDRMAHSHICHLVITETPAAIVVIPSQH